MLNEDRNFKMDVSDEELVFLSRYRDLPRKKKKLISKLLKHFVNGQLAKTEVKLYAAAFGAANPQAN